MKRTLGASLWVYGFTMVILLMSCFPAKAQDTSKKVSVLPDEIYSIVSKSCTPCHTSEGGLMAKSKLNFTEWSNYSPEKQKEKAAKMIEEISKGAMPPKMAREKRPETIPTKEQTEIIKKWSESFQPATK
jgi:mono/diheme cytochrome c family protein